MFFYFFKSVFFILFGVICFFSAASAEETSDTYIEMSKGDVLAPVEVIEYASFTCPHCATFHKEIVPKLEKSYIKTGKVNFIYREVYFDAPGLWAGLVARCSGAKSYFGAVDLLYQKQNTWAKGKNQEEILEGLFSIGRQLGLTDENIKLCIQNEKKALSLVKAYKENASNDSITSTPSLVINGKLHKNLSYPELKLEIDKLLKH